MLGSNNFSTAEKEDDQLGRTTQAEEKEEDPDHMDVMDTSDEEGDPKEISESEEQSELEFVEGVELEDIRKYMQCPICLGIIRKATTVMGCLHRFCKECIDKSMRQGNHECPTCRIHCASRRSLRPDPQFDDLIAATFGNIETYEDQDLGFDENESARNKQIQESIAEVSQRQSEALVKLKSSGEDIEVLPRSQPSGSGSRRGRRRRNIGDDTSGAHDDDGDNNRGRASSSAEPSAEILPRRKRKRRSATRSTARPSSGPNNSNNNVPEETYHIDCREILAHELAWGSCGIRSHIGHGINNNQGASSKSVRKARLNSLVEYLTSLESNSV